MPPTKRGTNVITLKVVNFMFPRMSPFMKQSPSLLFLSFRGKVFKKLKSLMLEYMALNERGRGVNCLREVLENFSRFNKILCVNPEQESS